MKLRPATCNDEVRLAVVRASLRTARTQSIKAGCPKLTKKIRSAIASLGGAERHLYARLSRG